MKTHLISFFKEFAYEQEDTQCLLNAYDTICLPLRNGVIAILRLSCYNCSKKHRRNGICLMPWL